MPAPAPVCSGILASRRRGLERTVLFAWVAALSACSGGDDGGPGVSTPDVPRTVAEVMLSADSLFFGGVGMTRSLSATGRAADGSAVAGATFTWTSSVQGVVTVDASGQVTAVGPGEATVTARSGTGSASAKAVVLPVAKEIRVSPAVLVLDSLAAVGGFSAQVVDSGGTAMADQPPVSWFSSSGDVAPISADGKVEARGAGTAEITAVDPEGGLAGVGEVRVEIQGLADVIGPEGATVSLADGVAELRVPDGAVTRSVALTVAREDLDGSVPGTGLQLGPELSFVEPAELEIHYDEAALQGGTDERSLGLYRQDGSGWTEVAGIGIDENANTVVGLIQSTGRYALRPGWMKDPSGLWLAEETTVADGCFGEVGNVETTRVFAELQGRTLTVEREGESVSGTLVGSEFGWDLTYPSEDYPGVDVREIYSVRIDRSGATATGKGRLIASGGANCEIRTTLTAKRISTERPVTDNVGVLRFNIVSLPSPFEPGDRVQLQVEAFDPTGQRNPVQGAFVDLLISQPGVFDADAPGGLPLRVQTFTTFTLQGGLVGTTDIQAVAYGNDGTQVLSEVLTLSVSRDPTQIRVLAPSELELQPGPLLVNGTFFDLAPVIAWQDDDPTAVRWELVTPWGTRFRLRPRRSGCSVGERCVDQVRDFWMGSQPTITAMGATRIEGFNVLDQRVSVASFTQTQAVRNEVSFGGVEVGSGWNASGFGGEVPSAVLGERFPNGAAFSCGEGEPCLHARLAPAFGQPSRTIVIERWTGSYIDRERFWITVPESMWNLVAPWGQGSGVGTTWNCDPNALPPQDQRVSVTVGYQANGARRGYTTRNGRLLSDPAGLACEGAVHIEIDQYTDLRGTWRRFKVTGSGDFITGSGEDVSVVGAGFSAVGVVKWAAGELDGVRFWAPGAGGG